MSEVLIVNGPPGVGKSTVTGLLRELLPGTVAIEGDALRGFAPADSRAQLGGGATYRAAGALVRAYLELGAPRVIFDYVFLRPGHFRYFGEALPAGCVVRTFTLWAPLEVVSVRDQARAAPQRIGFGAHECYREMQQNTPYMGQILDNAASEPRDIAARIHALCSLAPPSL